MTVPEGMSTEKEPHDQLPIANSTKNETTHMTATEGVSTETKSPITDSTKSETTTYISKVIDLASFGHSIVVYTCGLGNCIDYGGVSPFLIGGKKVAYIHAYESWGWGGCSMSRLICDTATASACVLEDKTLKTADLHLRKITQKEACEIADALQKRVAKFSYEPFGGEVQLLVEQIATQS